MDSNIIQFLIHEIVNTGDYTLEGIANSTRIPIDVILEAAYANNHQLSISSWIKIIELYFQARPDIAESLLDHIIEYKENKKMSLQLILNEAC